MAGEELNFKARDIIVVMDMTKRGWWSGEPVDPTPAEQQAGRHVFPSNFVSTPRRQLPVPVPQPTRTYTDDGRLILSYGVWLRFLVLSASTF